VGVWETVASVGIVMSKALPFTTSNLTIKTFRHALSLDEHRAKFRPNLYHRPAPNEQGAVNDPEHASPPLSSSATFESSRASLLNGQKKGKFGLNGAGGMKSKRLFPSEKKKAAIGKGKDAESEDELKENRNGEATVDAVLPGPEDSDPDDIVAGGTDVKEIWFCGVHSDVGGGSVSDCTTQSLADITLRWMVREVMMSQCGILFDNEALQRLGISECAMTVPTTIPSEANQSAATKPGSNDTKEVKLNAPGTTVTTSPASGSDGGVSGSDSQTKLDLIDAVKPEHDELGWKGKWAWWLLEIIPTSYAWQDKDGVWHKTWSIHLGKGRIIPDPNPKFHITVKERMEDAKLKYKPSATWTGNPVYVED